MWDGIQYIKTLIIFYPYVYPYNSYVNANSVMNVWESVKYVKLEWISLYNVMLQIIGCCVDIILMNKK